MSTFSTRSFGFDYKQLSCGKWEGCLYECLEPKCWLSTSWQSETLAGLFEVAKRNAQKLWVRGSRCWGFSKVYLGDEPKPAPDLNALKEFCFDYGQLEPYNWDEVEPGHIFDGAFYEAWTSREATRYVSATNLFGLFEKAQEMTEELCRADA